MKNTAIIILLLIIAGSIRAQEVTPTRLVNQTVDIQDDLDFENLNLAIERQLNSYQARGGLKGTIKFGSTVYPKSVLKDSLVLLRDIAIKYKTCASYLEKIPCASKLTKEINERFSIYAPVPRKGDKGYQKTSTTHFTSYYSPDLTGSRVPTERFKNPIYKLPPGNLATAYTRTQIDYDKMLSGKGLELFWVEDSFFDLYLLHVQGGGRVTVHNPDGSEEIKYISYAGANKKKCEFIGKNLSRIAKIPLEEARRIPVQRKYLEQNPDKEREIFDVCRNYVYFVEKDQEPVGRDSISLTVDRSLAIDSRIYKTTGLITFVKTQKSVQANEDGSVVKQPFSRIFLAQDTGSKILGPARCDLYMGYGPVAELIAYNMDDMGEQYFLIKK